MSAHLYSTDLIFKQTFEETVRIFLQILPNATGEKQVCQTNQYSGSKISSTPS